MLGALEAPIVYANHETPPSVCGDGILDPWEFCDDGNSSFWDSCFNNCTFTCVVTDPVCREWWDKWSWEWGSWDKGSWSSAVCGNGVIESWEACDDGNSIDTDYCTNSCILDCPSSWCIWSWWGFGVCGDWVLHSNEFCDDGNTLDGDWCSSLCVPECTKPRDTCALEGSVCGNSIIESWEDCDDGNTLDRDGCSSICHNECIESSDIDMSHINPIQWSGTVTFDIQVTNNSSDFITNTFGWSYPWYCNFNGNVSIATWATEVIGSCSVPVPDGYVLDILDNMSSGGSYRRSFQTGGKWVSECSSFNKFIWWSLSCTSDTDGDSVCDTVDNCPDDANTNQVDANGYKDNMWDGDACEVSYCGDGVTEDPNGELESEECDDGNNENNDGCSATCQDEVCGDGIINNNNTETCDDGANGDDTDGCTDSCTFTYCGDGTIQSPNGEWVEEACDDGANGDNTDGCTDSCTLTFCGDDIIQLPNGVWTQWLTGIGDEQCDGFYSSTWSIACTQSCTWTWCNGTGTAENWIIEFSDYLAYATDNDLRTRASGLCTATDIVSWDILTWASTTVSNIHYTKYVWALYTGGYIDSIKLYDSGSPLTVDLSSCIFDGSDVDGYRSCVQTLLNAISGNHVPGISFYYSAYNERWFFNIRFNNKHNPAWSWVGINKSDSEIIYSQTGTGTISESYNGWGWWWSFS